MQVYHLYGGHVLTLLHVDMGNVEPHITKISRGFTHLGEDVASLINTALVSQNTALKREKKISATKAVS